MPPGATSPPPGRASRAVVVVVSPSSPTTPREAHAAGAAGVTDTATSAEAPQSHDATRGGGGEAAGPSSAAAPTLPQAAREYLQAVDKFQAERTRGQLSVPAMRNQAARLQASKPGGADEAPAWLGPESVARDAFPDVSPDDGEDARVLRDLRGTTTPPFVPRAPPPMRAGQALPQSLIPHRYRKVCAL